MGAHDVRRSFVSHLLAAGADLAGVRRLTGHANPEKSDRYAGTVYWWDHETGELNKVADAFDRVTWGGAGRAIAALGMGPPCYTAWAMTRRQDDLLSKALMLPVPERAQLAHQILESLKDEDFDDNIRQAWQAEIARRLAEVRDGTAETCSWEEIEAELLEAEAQHGR